MKHRKIMFLNHPMRKLWEGGEVKKILIIKILIQTYFSKISFQNSMKGFW